ncbi:MAG: RNA polymerase sigma factor [Hyphomicrobium sp.]
MADDVSGSSEALKPSDGPHMLSDVREEMVALLPRLRRFAFARTGSMPDADDLVQAACEKALSRLDQFEPGTRLDSWMFRIVQTTWIDNVRFRVRRPHVSNQDIVEAIPFNDRISERAEARSDLDVVRQTMDELPDDQRAVLILVAIDGQSYQDAAEILGVPIGTIMSRLSRARAKLADAVERRNVDNIEIVKGAADDSAQ